MDYHELIEIDPGRRSGQPCVVGTRISVQDVLDYLAGGMSEADILSDFPDLTHERIAACIAYAADRERKLRSSFL